MDELERQLAAGRELLEDLELGSYSVTDAGTLVLNVLQRSLQDADSKGFWHATTLFRDLVIGGPNPKPLAVRFRESYWAGDQSQIVKQLERGLEHSHLTIRRNSVYTLAKIGSVSSLKKMLAAFDRAIQSDPAMLARLVQEIHWIDRTAPDPSEFEGLYAGLLDRLVASDSYLNRWAAVEIIQALSAVEADDRQRLAKLNDDPDLLVQYQARNEEDSRKKHVDFATVSDQFQSTTHYTAADFNQFVNEWVAKRAPDFCVITALVSRP